MTSNTSSIDKNIWQEFVVGSGVNPELVGLNISTISGNNAYEHLMYSDKLERTNTGRLSTYWMSRYSHLSSGGWWCSSITLDDGSDSLWGCFKPNKPRQDSNGKTVKYEHPPKTTTECFFLKVSPYIWELIAAKSGRSLPENYMDVLEFPVIFWRWVVETNIPIMLTEGVKKTLAALSCGYCAIGFPGVSSIAKQNKDREGNKIGKPYLIPQLKPFLGSKRKIIFAFDRDQKQKTIRNVNNAIQKAGKLLQYASCSVHVAIWTPKLGKGLDDVLVNNGGDKIDEIYKSSYSFPKWQTYTLKQLTYPANVVLNQQRLCKKDDSGRFIPDFKMPANWDLLALKAHKSAGKTTLIDYIISPVISSGEKKVLLITHRITLGKKTCNDLGLTYIDDATEDDILNNYHLGLCADSLLKINPDDWKGCILILDEVQQLIWHILNSNTCRKKRVAILKHFQRLLNTIRETGGKIIIADADLRDDGIDFILNQINQETKLFLLVNNYKRDENDRWKIYNYKDKNPARLISDLGSKLAEGKKIMLCVSGQQAKSTWGSQVLEAHFNKSLPDIKILRVDSNSVGEVGHPACGILNNFHEAIKGYDLVICSPTIETGISLDFDYFDAVFGIFQGVQTCDSVRQHISRYRKPVPRYLYISPTGINSNKIGNGACNVRELLAGEYGKDKANIGLLANMGFKENLEGSFDNLHLNHWAINGAIINDGFANYRNQILEDLELEGHEIINLKKDETTEYSPDGIRETREDVYDRHCQDIEDAKEIDSIQLETLDKKAVLSKAERDQRDKAKLRETYQVDVKKDLIKKHDQGWLSEIKKHYLIDNPDSLYRQDKNYILSALDKGDGYRMLADDNKFLMAKKIDLLVNNCKIKEVIMADGLHEFHPLAKEVGDNVRKHYYDLKLFIGDFKDRQIDKTSNMFILRRLLAVIGYKLPQLKQARINKQQVRLHGVAAPGFETEKYINNKGEERTRLKLDANGKAIAISDGREEVFAAWKVKELADIEREQEKLRQEKFTEDESNRLLEEMNSNYYEKREQENKYSQLEKEVKLILNCDITNKDYWGCVRTVEIVEAQLISPDRLGRLSKEQSDNNKFINNLLDRLLNDNQAIHELQKNQSSWFKGDRQLIKPDGKRAKADNEKIMSKPPTNQKFSTKTLIRDINKEQKEFADDVKTCKNYIMNGLFDEAKKMINSCNKLYRDIKIWLENTQEDFSVKAIDYGLI